MRFASLPFVSAANLACLAFIFCKFLNQRSNQGSIFRDGVRIVSMRLDNTYRVNVMIQFVSHVLPASSEKACSKRLEFGVMAEKPLRDMMILPLNSSWS